jgi:hypothetical protein
LDRGQEDSAPGLPRLRELDAGAGLFGFLNFAPLIAGHVGGERGWESGGETLHLGANFRIV